MEDETGVVRIFNRIWDIFISPNNQKLLSMNPSPFDIPGYWYIYLETKQNILQPSHIQNRYRTTQKQS